MWPASLCKLPLGDVVDERTGAMKNPRAKIIPATPRVGDVVEVKTLITHVMETGSRRDGSGRLVPRHIIAKFSAEFDGRVFFSADFNPGISANPYLSFKMRITGPGMLNLTWIEDGGQKAVLKVPVKVA